MVTPDLLVMHGSASEQPAPVSLEGLRDRPALPNERLPGDFKVGQQVMTLYFRTWMERPELVVGEITDVVPSETPFMLRMPLGIDFQGIVARVAELHAGEVNLDTLKKDPNPEPLRQYMLNDRELRPHMPSPGFINIRTAQTPDNRSGRIIGIDMNSAALIPRPALSYLANEAYLRALVEDGSITWSEERDELEAAIRRRIAEGTIGYDMPPEPADEHDDVYGGHHPTRAREHVKLIPGSGHGKVAAIPPQDTPEDQPVLRDDPTA